jgi:RND family efflux transporter MFP subunit
MAEIKKSLELATDVYERQARLWEQNIGSEVQYLQAKNNKERLQKTLETAEFQMTKANIYSPISGTVDMENLKQGEIASPGMPILSILNVTNVKVNTDLPERYLRIVRSGQYVDMSFPSIQMEMKGKVTQLGRTIDPSNRTLEVEITPSKYSTMLKPNLLAEIKVEEIRLKDVITIPVEFVLQEVDATEFVFIVEGDGSEARAKKRYITTGEASNGSIVVLSGLNIGDRLITRGTRNVSDNELIEFFQTKQP